MFRKLWRRLKQWRRLRLGPLSLLFKFERSVKVSSNSGRRIEAAIHRHHRWLIVQAHQNAAAPSALPLRAQVPKPSAQIALIVGVGPGFGFSLVRRLAADGMLVIAASRNAERLDELTADVHAAGGSAFAYGCDATDEASVASLFAHVRSRHGVPHLVVYSLQYFAPGQTVDVELPAFEDAWKHNCLGAFLVAKEAAKSMLPLQSGTIILPGSASSVLGRAGHLNLAIGKFG